MEQTKQCSGICQQIDRYIFTDVGKGKPQQSCGLIMQNELVQEVEEQRLLALILLISSLVISFALGLLIKLHPNVN